MKNAIIYPIRAELLKFSDDNGERVMTRFHYAIQMSNSHDQVGYAVLTCTKPGNHLEFIKPYIMQKVKADIEERPTDKGCNYVLVSINDKVI